MMRAREITEASQVMTGSMVTRDPAQAGAIFGVLVGDAKRAPGTLRGPSCWLVFARG
jgi:hypothetical protein